MSPPGKSLVPCSSEDYSRHLRYPQYPPPLGIALTHSNMLRKWGQKSLRPWAAQSISIKEKLSLLAGNHGELGRASLSSSNPSPGRWAPGGVGRTATHGRYFPEIPGKHWDRGKFSVFFSPVLVTALNVAAQSPHPQVNSSMGGGGRQ